MLTSLRIYDLTVGLHNFNDDFLLLRSEEAGSLAALGKAIYQRQFDFVEEVIATEVEICLKLRMPFTATHAAELERLEAVAISEPKSYRLPVYFCDACDWSGVEAVSGLSKPEFIEQLLSGQYTVAMFGFLPGFVYIDGLDAALHIPRKSVPAKSVEANSLAIGGRYLGIYSVPSPGGWHVIGKIPVTVMDLGSLPPVVLQPDDVLVLEMVDGKEYTFLINHPISLSQYNART